MKQHNVSRFVYVFSSSNTGGLGGAFGYFYGVGKPLPIPEAKPFKPSFRFWMLQKVGSLAKKIKGTKEGVGAVLNKFRK